MTIKLQVTGPRPGTTLRTLQYLAGERAVGTLSISFRNDVPPALIHVNEGRVASAKFGELVGRSVFDVILCQEFSIVEICFVHTRIFSTQSEEFHSDPATIFEAVKNQVKSCGSRPLIYGSLRMRLPGSSVAPPLLQVLHSFQQYRPQLETWQPSSELQKDTPLPQCALLCALMNKGVTSYQVPLVALANIRPLLGFLDPSDKNEAERMLNYLRSLLPHEGASHLPLEKFYAYAGAIESVASRQGAHRAEECRQVILQILGLHGNDGGAETAEPFQRPPRS